MKTRHPHLMPLVVAAFVLSAPSFAIPLDGHTLGARVVFQGVDPYPGTSVSFVVDSTPGVVEVPAYGGAAAFSIDVFDVDPTHASIVFTSFRTEPFSYGSSPNNVVFTDIFGAIPDILDVSIGSFNWPGADSASRVTFTTDSFSFDFGDMRLVAGDYFQLDITTAATVASVPETGNTVGLLGVAFIAMALVMRKRLLVA
jgi:hypothetical protein